MTMTRGILMIQSSIAECRKAIDYLTEAGEISSTTVMLDGEKHLCPAQPASEAPMSRGHQLVLRDDNTLECELCGRKYHSSHRELTRLERHCFEKLSPAYPF